MAQLATILHPKAIYYASCPQMCTHLLSYSLGSPRYRYVGGSAVLQFRSRMH